MHIYADQLVRRMQPLLKPDEQIREYLVSGARSAGLGRYWDQYVRYQRFARDHAGDVNHVVDHGFAHLVASLPPERTLVTFHDAIVARVDGVRLGTRLAFRYSLRALRRAKIVVADSETSRADLLSLIDYPPERVSVIYPGIHPSFRPGDNRAHLRQQYGLDGVAVLHVGHTQPYMNIEAVLGTCARLVRVHRLDVRLVKVGGALTRAQWRLAQRLGIDHRIVSLGRVPLGTLCDLYRAADVLLYPVHYAGFGLPPLEAMASGLPVVCSNRGALPEVIGDAAATADPEDEAAMAEAVAALVEDARLRQARVAAGLARARAFSWDRTAADTLALYRRLVEGGA
jgi:glycosyltransferase involved in cell wall biosynthesis